MIGAEGAQDVGPKNTLIHCHHSAVIQRYRYSASSDETSLHLRLRFFSKCDAVQHSINDGIHYSCLYVVLAPNSDILSDRHSMCEQSKVAASYEDARVSVGINNVSSQPSLRPGIMSRLVRSRPHPCSPFTCEQEQSVCGRESRKEKRSAGRAGEGREEGKEELAKSKELDGEKGRV